MIRSYGCLCIHRVLTCADRGSDYQSHRAVDLGYCPPYEMPLTVPYDLIAQTFDYALVPVPCPR